MKYYFTKETTVVIRTVTPLSLSLLRPDMPVRYTYVRKAIAWW